MRKSIQLGKNIVAAPFVNFPEYVYISDFDEEGFKKFQDDFSKVYNMGFGIVPIVIDSFGGHVYALNGIVSIIRACDVPVATIVETKAASAGAVLASSGTRGYRYIAPYGTIMVHQAAGMVSGKVDEMKNRVVHIQTINDAMIELLDENCQKPKGFFKKMIGERKNTDWFFTANQAKRLGIVDKIGSPTLTVEVSQKVVLK